MVQYRVVFSWQRYGDNDANRDRHQWFITTGTMIQALAVAGDLAAKELAGLPQTPDWIDLWVEPRRARGPEPTNATNQPRETNHG